VKKEINNLLNSASEAAKLIREHIEKENPIHVASHYDADGLAAGGIIGKCLVRLGGKFCVRIERWMDEKVIERIAATGKNTLVIFTDFGSGDLNLLGEGLSKHRVIILDHHQPVGEAPSTFIHVNPHLHGIDGSRDLSGAGTAYLVAKALDETNVDLASIAAVGALGDLQDKYEQKKLGGVNEIIVEDGVKSGCLEIETDLLFFGRETRPIHKALACTTNPFIPGISGQEDASYSFLVKARWNQAEEQGQVASFERPLGGREKEIVFCTRRLLGIQGISKRFCTSLIRSVYTLTREEPWTPLRDAREFAVLLNATGRMEKPGLGIALCMGDRGLALEQANVMLAEYRRDITKYLNWLNEDPERITELNNIYLVLGEDFIHENVIGTVSSILSNSLPKHEKPIIAYSTVQGESLIKVSARASESARSKGLNLGEILRVAAEKYSGKGGGHDVAAGAQVPVENIESFVKLVDELVKKSLEET